MNIAPSSLAGLGLDVTVIDVSKASGREIRGAIRYRPAELLLAGKLVLPRPSDRPVVVYDDDGGMTAGPVVERLRDSGYNASLLDGGLAAWEETGGATQETTLEQPL